MYIVLIVIYKFSYYFIIIISCKTYLKHANISGNYYLKYILQQRLNGDKYTIIHL